MRMEISNADMIKLAIYRIFKMHKWQRLDKELIIIIRVEMELEGFNETSSEKSIQIKQIEGRSQGRKSQTKF